MEDHPHSSQSVYARSKKQNKNKHLQTLSNQDGDVGTQHRKNHDKQCTNNTKNYKWLLVSLPNQNTNIFQKPNIDAALWGPLSYNQSFLSIFLSVWHWYVPFFFSICLFLTNFSRLAPLSHFVPLPFCTFACRFIFVTFSFHWPDQCIQMEVKDRALHYSNPSREWELVAMTGKFPLKQAICWDKAGKK